MAGGPWRSCPRRRVVTRNVAQLVKRPGSDEVYAAGYVGENDDADGAISDDQRAILWRTK